MIRHFLTLFAGALLLSGCSAPDPLSDRDWPEAAPALWEVTSASGEKGWLFGTVHALPDGLEWQSEPVEEAFTASGLLLVEIAELANGNLAADEFSARANSAGLPPLLERIPSQHRDAAEYLLELAGAEEGDFEQTETWAAAMILSGAMRSGDPANGVDRALLARTRNAAGLEGHAAQYAVFDALPESEQADLLVAIAHEAQAYDPVASLEAWLTGDMAALEDLAGTGLLADPQLREALLNRRNRDWAPRIAEYIDGGSAPFVAVGAAHMLGDTGLPALLQARGYSVIRIQ